MFPKTHLLFTYKTLTKISDCAIVEQSEGRNASHLAAGRLFPRLNDLLDEGKIGPLVRLV